MMPGRNLRKSAPPAAPAEREVAVECALQLRRIGDKWDLRQRILNLLAKLFFPET
ncbi:phorbol-12-myristate-13-acetate-induced protein 1 [Columba livia]|uniref:phorbol-12-myristate-13-acetate-induced protein 1 n=1 Tax=Columba livia TaxID=8932 RepID=UPI0003991BB6|nr:phorbol-12-myristate-13-acetate-induced protein 1 [Columba livia]